MELVDGAGWTEDTACSGSTEDGATGGGAGALGGATGGAEAGAFGGAEALAVVVVDAAGLGPGAQ